MIGTLAMALLLQGTPPELLGNVQRKPPAARPQLTKLLVMRGPREPNDKRSAKLSCEIAANGRLQKCLVIGASPAGFGPMAVQRAEAENLGVQPRVTGAPTRIAVLVFGTGVPAQRR